MKTEVCPKCKGTGKIKKYEKVEAGICFQCKGTGKVNGSTRSFSKKITPLSELYDY